MDRLHRSSGSIMTSKRVLDDAAPFPVPITSYRFRLADGVDAPTTSKAIESAFLEHGMSSVVGAEELEREAGAGRAFGRLFTGFMALGLLVGIAALGIVSTRAVVERRQQIGVLRAIGYRRRMVLLSFLIESSFVSLLGTLLGATLGIILAWQAFTGITSEEGVETLSFTDPVDRDRLHPGGHLRLLGAGDVPAGKAGVQDLPRRSPTLRVARNRRRDRRRVSGLARHSGRRGDVASALCHACWFQEHGAEQFSGGYHDCAVGQRRRGIGAPRADRGSDECSYRAGIRIFGWGRCHLTPLTLVS